jgi:hypothetical protein
MAATDTAICNMALGLIQVDPITDLTNVNETGEPARLCRLFYTNARDSLLQAPFPEDGDSWAFAIARTVLVASSDTNYTPWTYIYDLPDGGETPAKPICLRPLVLLDSSALYIEMPSVSFRREGTYLYTDLASAALKYVASPAATAMTEAFVLALAWRLAAYLIKPLNGTSPIDPASMAVETLREAIASDGHGKQEPGVPEQSWVGGRFG